MVSLIKHVDVLKCFMDADATVTYAYLMQFNERDIVSDNQVGFVRAKIIKIDMFNEKVPKLQTERYVALKEIEEALKITLKYLHLIKKVYSVGNSLKIVKQHPILSKWLKKAIIEKIF